MTRIALSISWLAWFCITPSLGLAQTRLDTDTTWTGASSPIHLDTDTIVDQGVRLTIEPGVTVELDSGINLIISGELVARGTEADPITFTGSDEGSGPARWGSLTFEGTSTHASFVALDDYQSGSIVEHCTFEHATRAVQLDRASPFIHNCTFRENLFVPSGEKTGGAAIFVSGGSAPRIQGCTFVDNVCESTGEGAAIWVEYAQPIIQDNIFTGNQSGYGGALTTYFYNGPVVGNRFEGNNSAWEGGATAFVSSTPAFLNNQVTGNRTFMDGGGVHVCTTCYPHANPFLMDNVITDNISDVSGAAGVGAAYIRIFSHNDVHSNLRADQPADFGWFNHVEEGYPTWVSEPHLPNNWWGTTEPDEIDEAIEDGDDNQDYGVVDYQPISTGPVATPQTRITITTLKIEYLEPDEPMTVFINIYNPGPARSVDLLLGVQYGQGPPTFYHGPLDFPGATREGDTYRLQLPENSAYFTILATPRFTPATGLEEGSWHAALFDTATQERIGDVCSIRFAFGGTGS